MATLTVSSAAELRSAISSASSGDTILLANGSYGDVSLKNVSDLTLKAQSDGAVLDGLTIRNSDDVTIDGLTLDGDTDSSGYGTGTGVVINSSDGVTIQNTEITDFAKGIQVWNAEGLTIKGNTLDNISYDGMVLGHVQNTLIDGNDVTMHGRESVDHKDVIQIYNQGDKAPASDITISNNTLTAEDGNIHGIYMGNADASSSGSSSEYYSDITITGNVIDIQNKLGIAVGQTDGLTISDNVVLQNSGADDVRAMNTPLIMVEKDSDNVSVTGNTVLDTPTAAGTNWQESGISGSGWKISGNEVVSASTSVSDYDTGSSSGSSDSSSSSDTTTTTDTGTSTAANTETSTGTTSADEFRFAGDRVDGDTSVTFDGVDFSAGDTLKLGRYDAGTFEDVRDGNIVHNNDSGTYVKIDSLVDIAEIAQASDAVSAHVSGDDLTVTIEQDSGTLDLVLAGLGQAYQDSYDTTLF